MESTAERLDRLAREMDMVGLFLCGASRPTVHVMFLDIGHQIVVSDYEIDNMSDEVCKMVLLDKFIASLEGLQTLVENTLKDAVYAKHLLTK